jgi:hypothetical protein
MTSVTYPDQTGRKGAYVVRSARPADAIGSALRNIFSARAQMPDDMARLLSRLD